MADHCLILMKQLQRLKALMVLLLPLLSLAQMGKHEYTVDGNIKGLGADSVVLFISHYAEDGSRIKSDTIIAKAASDRFHLTGSVQAPKFVWMQLSGLKSRKSFSFFLEEGRITINGTMDSLERLSVTGTPSNNDMTNVRSVTGKVFDRIVAIRSQLKNEQEGSDEYKRLLSAMAAKADSMNAYEIAFIKSHPHSYASSIFLYVKQDKVPVDELETMYNSLDEGVRKSDMVLMIPGKIRAKRSVAIGNKAPDFASYDTSGKTVKLSDFQGKYVLLEFWASWCVPCRKQNPHLIEMYQKYAGKGFTILQYSVDDSNAAAKWKEAIRKDQLLWTQISDLAGLGSSVSKLYGVQPIPDNFLIDPKGIILARGIEGTELDQKLFNLLNK